MSKDLYCTPYGIIFSVFPTFHTLTCGSQSIQWLTIKDRPWILLQMAYHLIALPTAHPPEGSCLTGEATGSTPKTIVGTSDCKLKLETEEGLKTTVSASKREWKTGDRAGSSFLPSDRE